jgi:hypothetical protein
MTKQRSEPVDAPPTFSYMLIKARRFVKIGAIKYRKHDAFNMPLEEWPEELLARVQKGMEQICEFRGYSREKPFEELDVDGFSALMATLHFAPEQQGVTFIDVKTVLDEMQMKHQVVDLRIVLFNKVNLPSE